jgi:hypothetical protein
MVQGDKNCFFSDMPSFLLVFGCRDVKFKINLCSILANNLGRLNLSSYCSERKTHCPFGTVGARRAVPSNRAKAISLMLRVMAMGAELQRSANQDAISMALQQRLTL